LESFDMPIPSDPLLAQQWHLDNPNPNLLDLNVLGVWNPAGGGPAYTGAGTRVVVVDNGFDYNHPDFANYDQSLDFDFEFNILDAFGTDSDSHGTAVAGIIGAAANGTGAVGVAYGTSLVGYRTFGFISDAWLQDIRDSIYYGAVNAQADVINISQGISNDSFSEFGFGYNAARFEEIESSINSAVDLGRGGLGTTVVQSAGNSRSNLYDVNADDWGNDTRQVVVAAVDQNGFVSSYSSYGAVILVSGFGTPGEVFTTDRRGAAGYDSGAFTSTFNGTSSAAPMVAGVVALMYDAAPGLGWRDVQSILAASARHVGSEVGGAASGFERYGWDWNGATNWNGGGMHFSNDYGYGLVDALAAVRLAETWLLGGQVAQVSNNEFTNVVDVHDGAVVIPDGNPAGRSFSSDQFEDDLVERATVQITFSTTFVGDLQVYLVSPDGTVSELISQNGGGADFNGTWTFESQAFRGERAGGTWTVRVVDAGGGDALVVSDVVITTYGVAANNDRFIFTNEYSDHAGSGGHVTSIVDTNGGVDSVNASAVSSGSVIRLNGAVGSIDGVAVSFSGVEHAIGGDGADRIFGSGGNNLLYGMRGLDTLNGAAGNDTLVGGYGSDTMLGGAGNDTYVVASAGDRVFETTTTTGSINAGGNDIVQSLVSFNLDANAGVRFVERLTLTGTGAINGFGNALANTLVGNSGNNVLNGGNGSDILFGRAGNDKLVGGVGNDRLAGEAGNDTLTGNAGADAFVFRTGSNGVDVIADFNQLNGGGEEGDVLRFEGLEVGSFVYRGAGGFTGGSDNSEARVSGNQVLIDTNGDGVSDIRITLAGLANASQLSASDFLFV
jgi:subtilisin family serine protease